eukprot:364695-Chlamydomonas_euryale.AAC.9
MPVMLLRSSAARLGVSPRALGAAARRRRGALPTARSALSEGRKTEARRGATHGARERELVRNRGRRVFGSCGMCTAAGRPWRRRGRALFGRAGAVGALATSEPIQSSHFLHATDNGQAMEHEHRTPTKDPRARAATRGRLSSASRGG